MSQRLWDLIEWLQFNWMTLCIALLILASFHVFRKSIEKTLFRLIRSIASKMPSDQFEDAARGFERPAATWISLLGFYAAFQYLCLNYPGIRLATSDTPERLMKSLTVVCIAMGFYNLGDLYGTALIKLDDKLNLNTSELFKKMVSKVTRVLIVLLAVGMAASEFFDVNGFIAGLGIAGLAVAMAAQDTLGNMIAGAAIVVDRPYDLGDWILCEGIEGEVEELTFRSTRIRTVTQEIVYIPNSNMSKSPITNFTRRGFRRVEIQALLDFATAREQIEALQAALETYLKAQSFVREEGIIVKLDQVSAYGLGFSLKCFVNTNVYNEYIQYKEQINLELIGVLGQLGISIARPMNNNQAGMKV